MKYWLIKSEPGTYSWENLVADGETAWTGVRNYAARLNLLAMKKGDLAFFYHSNEGLCVLGIAQIERENYSDPTDKEGRWICVDLKPFRKLENPVTLTEMKKVTALKQMDLLRIGRLSVSKVQKKEWEIILKLGKAKI